MRFFRKLSLGIALLSFALSAVVMLVEVLGDCHILTGGLNNNQILAIISFTAIVFFLCFLFLSDGKRLFVWICAILIGLTGLTSLFIGFVPNHRYTQIVSEDGKHTMVVEEKTANSSIYIRVYEKINPYVYSSKYAVTLSQKEQIESYQYGDFYIVFKEKAYDVCIPTHNKAPISIHYHKSTKTSD